jgi:acyl-coenzyme A thioesterase PaaI-like protein
MGNVASAEHAIGPVRHRAHRISRVNFLRQFRSGPESRYVGTALRVGRSSGVAEAQAVGDDGKAAIIARITAYLG